MAATLATESLTEASDTSLSSDAASDVYQSVSKAAIAALILSVLGLLAFWLLPLAILSVLGLIFAIAGLSAIKRFPAEFLGKTPALAGAALSVVTLLGAPAYHTVIYLTEVPDGYERLDFGRLKGTQSQDLPPADILKFNGQKVFIKGYIHPTSMDKMRAKKFVLVPDLGTCCFGTQPPLTHMIEVSLTGDQYARKSFRKQRLAGTLRINPSLKPVSGLDGVFYTLKADILK